MTQQIISFSRQTDDPLAPLLDLPGVKEAASTARAAIAGVHRHPTNRRNWPIAAAEASIRAARASAMIDSSAANIPEGNVIGDPLLAGALRVASALGQHISTWRRAPLQTLAKLHVLAASDLAEGDSLGRPTASADVTARLGVLAQLVAGATTAPAPILVAVVHGELLALSPFAAANGVVARAAARLTMVATGLDPKSLTVPEVDFLRRKSEYCTAAKGFAEGTATGLAKWLVLCCNAMKHGAQEAEGIAAAL